MGRFCPNRGRCEPIPACVVQTVIPTVSDIEWALKNGDPTLGNPALRKKHRNHLSAALAAVKRMLALRDTHMGTEGRLDWLILPELAVHPSDVHTHLVPFARAHQAIILTGLTYDRVLPGRWCRKVGGKLENWRKLRIVKHSERRCAAAERSLRHETSYGIDVAQSIFR